VNDILADAGRRRRRDRGQGRRPDPGQGRGPDPGQGRGPDPGLGRRRAPWWLVFALGTLASVALAVRMPSSWWGAAFVVSVAGLMATLRNAVPETYRAGWGRATLIVMWVTVTGGAAYAFAVEPLGPRVPVTLGIVGVLLLSGLAVGGAPDGGPGYDRTGGRISRV